MPEDGGADPAHPESTFSAPSANGSGGDRQGLSETHSPRRSASSSHSPSIESFSARISFSCASSEANRS